MNALPWIVLLLLMLSLLALGQRFLSKRSYATTIRSARGLVALVVGFTLLLVGGAFLFLPGPGTPVIILGLTVLATEFVWARRWLRRLRAAARLASMKAAKAMGRTRQGDPPDKLDKAS